MDPYEENRALRAELAQRQAALEEIREQVKV
jgi:hypothetical protein